MYDIRVAARPEDFCSQWLQLQVYGASLPFQQYDWVRLWCEVMAPESGAAPCIVLVSKMHTPLMLLPLCIVRRRLVRSLEFTDSGLSDYNAPVLSPQASQLSFDAWTQLLRRIFLTLPRHDIVHLRRMASVVDGARNPLMQLNIPQVDEEVGHSIPVGSYEARAYSPIKEAVRKRRKLLRSHTVEFVHGTDLTAFDTLIDWKRAQYPATFNNAPMVRFQRSVLAECEQARLFKLLIDGRLVAAQFALISGKMCTGIINGYDPAWSAVSPGKLLTSYLLEYLQAHGFQTFDTGRGKEAYKAEYGEVWRQLYCFRQIKTPRGLLYQTARHTVRTARTCTKRWKLRF